MQIVDYVIDDGQLLIQLEVLKTMVNLFRAKSLAKDLAVVDLVQLAHHLYFVSRQFVHVFCRLKVAHSSLLIKRVEVEDVSIEGTFDELADGLTVDQLVGVVAPLRFGIEVHHAAIVHPLADVVWVDYDLILSDICLLLL